MAEVELRERSAAARPIDDVARNARKQIVRVGAPDGALAEHDEQAASLRHETLEASPELSAAVSFRMTTR